MSETEDGMKYQVVMNREDVYSVWLAYRELPAGWRRAGPSGSRQECLNYIGKVWTDMRRRSVRLRTEKVVAEQCQGTET